LKHKREVLIKGSVLPIDKNSSRKFLILFRSDSACLIINTVSENIKEEILFERFFLRKMRSKFFGCTSVEKKPSWKISSHKIRNIIQMKNVKDIPKIYFISFDGEKYLLFSRN